MKPIAARHIAAITPLETVARKNARSDLDLQAAGKESCKTCPKPVWFTAFFDGTGNNFDQDGRGDVDVNEVKYSNVAKLAWFAHTPRLEARRTYFQYIEGVGTPCKKEGVNDSGEGLDKAGGMAVASKGEARIRWMMRRLTEDVNKHMPFVNQINIAVFGFSRGAAQARAFTRMLSEEMADWDGKQLLWKQPGVAGVRPKVVVYFMGLFDTVSSTGFGGSKAEKAAKSGVPTAVSVIPGIGPVLAAGSAAALYAADGGGHASWAHDLTIPDYVQRCVHYVAGHEVREKFPSDSVRRNKNLPSNCIEVVYPGVHSDVGGGYESADEARYEGRSNELARVPLCHMYIEAYRAGVPLDEPAKVIKRAGQLFDIDNVKDVFDAYMRTAPTLENTRLEKAVIWHMNRYYEWRESRHQRVKAGQLKPAVADLYMTITDKEWEEDVLRLVHARSEGAKGASGVHEAAVLHAHEGKTLTRLTPQERALFDLLFDKHVHDSIAGFKKQMTEASAALAKSEMSRWSINRKYFVGKSGKRFLYWRYESEGSGVAGIRFDDNDQRNYEGSDDSAPVDPEEQERAAKARRDRKIAEENTRHTAVLARIQSDSRAVLSRPPKPPNATGPGPWRMPQAHEDEYMRGAQMQREQENKYHAEQLQRIESETATPVQ